MASSINASTTAGVVTTADTSGVLNIQTAGTTAIAISAGQVATFAQAPVLPAASIPQAALAAGVAGTGPAFSAYRSTSQSISNATWSKVQFQTEEFDTANYYDNATNYRFTPLIAGYYQISGAVQFVSSSNFLLSVYKNGVEYATVGMLGVVALLDSQGAVSKLVYFNGSTDYVEVYCYQNSGGALNIAGRIANSYFTGVLVRSA